LPISLEALCAVLKPENTSLLLGAGASVPSGAPSGIQLAQRLWRDVAKSDALSEDLIETSGILERRFSRRPVIEALVSALRKLQPTGGMLGLPKFGWHSVFTTNFDQLMEAAYKSAGVPLVPIRSNYDFTYRESRSETTLYKLHGCISQDRSLGHKASMILTEQDYEDFEKYRQSLFSLLQACLLTQDVLIIGQSLRDRHLSDLIKRVLNYKQEGAPGNIYALIYESDDLRAPLLEDKGAKIAFGGIDDFVHAMASYSPAPIFGSNPADVTLPIGVVSIVENVDQARLRESNVVKMFNGASATFADIRAGVTFQRSQYQLAIEKIKGNDFPIMVIVGAGGVGKTTYARQILSGLYENGYLAVEHKNDFQFQSQPWIAIESDLRSKGQRAVLHLDECTRYLRQVNLLAEHIATLEDSALRVVMTANAAQWGPRIKSAAIFSHGHVVELSRLVDADLYALINLLEFNKSVADLVHPDFKSVSRGMQFTRLRERCSADMFVCLKNIFANDSLDKILLSEFDELEEFEQQHYRYIAALESVGMRVHRQLVMRMLGLRADQVSPVLSGLVGIVDEFEINARDGIYGWATRHIVIARKITEYKFSSIDDLEKLFKKIIENINPAIHTELQSIRDLCDTDYGIGRLGDSSVRKRLFRQLINVSPGERIPWHRLIRELLDENSLEETEYLIRDAIEAVGHDAPIDRYRVRLLVSRSEHTNGISPEDRLALLRKAYELAQKNIAKHKSDKYSYRVLCDVAVKLTEKGESPHILGEAIQRMREGAEIILDPDMDRELRRFDDIYFRISI
jgi:NAD-dependent SIR2 family protein deacetylase